MTDSIDDSSRTVKVKMLKSGIFSERHPYMKVTEIIWMLRNTTFDMETLADILEDSLRKRGHL